MTVRSWFVAANGRVRAPWRILLFFVISIVCWVGCSILLHSLLQPMNQLTGITTSADELIVAIALVLGHAIVLAWVDRQSWSYVSLHADAARPIVLARGLALGALPIGVPSLVLLGIGWLAVRPAMTGSWGTAAVQLSLYLLPAALTEELLSRGYIFATLREWLGGPVTLTLTSVGFGMAHLWNPGANARSLVLVILAGVFLGAVLIATGSLYAAWMAHWAWNWVMAVPLHAAVSGQPFAHPDYQIVDAGPDWITGGPWGPEGGIGAAAGMLTGLGYLYWRFNKKRNARLER